MDLTWVIAMVWVDWSSPSSVISDGELAVTVPVIVVPSRIDTVACGAPGAGVRLQELRSARARRNNG
jgi:hypothetical protein